MSEMAPFTQRQVDYIRLTQDCWLNVLEGGKRGTKNVTNVNAWCGVLEEHPDRLHLAAGVSVASANLNILDCDGFGLLSYFAGRYREGKYKGRECLFVKTRVGPKIILVSGGGKQGDEKLIKGNTYGTGMLTEANELHPFFVQESFDRTLSSSDRKLFLDFNPKPPKHRFYTDVLDFHEKQQLLNPEYGLNYAHLTIADNLSIDEDKLRRLLKTYNKGSIWYKRDILGLRIAAEGIIFEQFANNPTPYLYTELPDKEKLNLLSFGLDWGGNKSKTTFVATGFAGDFQRVYILRDKKLDGEKGTIDPERVYEAFYQFALEILTQYQVQADYVFCDSAEQILINGLRQYLYNKGLDIRVADCEKSTINARIAFKNSLLNLGRYKINAACKNVISSTASQVWDDKAKNQEDKRLDDGTIDIDTADAEEYSWTRYLPQIQRSMTHD